MGRNGSDREVIWVRREAKYFFGQDWTGSISLIRFDNSSPARRAVKHHGDVRKARLWGKVVPKRRRPEDSESFNQLVRTIPFEPRGVS
jgi:hypothetical protein